ncbi:MAG: Hsp20/alpha crystallin family protein [Dissulfuribacterales bacterium]
MFDLISRKKKEGNRSMAFRRKTDNLFNRFFENDFFPMTDPLWSESAFPKLDISEGKKKISVKAEIPGVDKKDIHVEIDGRILTLRGEKKQEKTEETDNYHRIERSYGSFRRSIRLPADVDEEKIKASFKRGVLQIELTKNKETQTRTIEIKTD